MIERQTNSVTKKKKVMSIKRSELKKIETETGQKFFYSESEAYEYKKSLGNIVAKVDQWHLELDDITEQEAIERKNHIEKLISERPYANEAQKELLRKAYYQGEDIWSVSVVSEKTPEEFYSEGYEVPMIDDEVEGWIPADSVKVIDDTRDQI